MASCGERFNVEGHIAGAADSTLYFEHMTLKGPVMLDSVILDANGAFAFGAERPEAPDFYRLRIRGQVINIAIDTTETVGITADYKTMATGYTVEGSDNCERIKQLAIRQQDLQRKAMQVERLVMDATQKRDSILSLIREYKKGVTADFVYVDPRQSSSYFALFQTVGRYLIFDPYSNRDDMKAFAAVATCWDAYYPGAERTKNLYSITMKGIENRRQEMADQAAAEAAAQAAERGESKVEYTGIIDIELADNHGKTRKLSDLKGNVVLLDFHLFSLDVSPARILQMRELYNKYHQRGLEIYQVALDENEHFWMQKVEQLPWISVRDPQGPVSMNVALYNVGGVPDYFLIDRDLNLVKRMAQVESIEKEIEKLLK